MRNGVYPEARAAARGQLDEAADAVHATLAQIGAERDALRRPDADADNLKLLTAQLLALVTERVDLLTGARLIGDVKAARLTIADGASFKGNVDMDV